MLVGSESVWLSILKATTRAQSMTHAVVDVAGLGLMFTITVTTDHLSSINLFYSNLLMREPKRFLDSLLELVATVALLKDDIFVVPHQVIRLTDRRRHVHLGSVSTRHSQIARLKLQSL